MLRIQYYIFVFLAGFSVLSVVQAQPLKLDITKIDTRNYPLVRVGTLVTRGDSIVPQSASTVYSVAEDGEPLSYTIDCPGNYNSIGIVVPNFWVEKVDTGAYDIIKNGLSIFIDSMNASDECMIATIVGGGTNSIPLTSDKAALHGFVNSISMEYGFREVNRTILLVLKELAKRDGRKLCIVISLAQNTERDVPGVTEADVLQELQATGIQFHQITWDVWGTYNKLLREMTVQAGGVNYIISREDTAGFQKLMAEIASEINDPACILTYTAKDCVDSLRYLEITATDGDEAAYADTLYRAPSRPDTIALIVRAEEEDLVPPRYLNVEFGLEPYVSQEMNFTFSFLIKFDPEEFHILPPLSTQGSVLEGETPGLKELRSGVWECTYDYGALSGSTGALMNIQFLVNTTAKTRPAIIAIDSMTLFNGCPNIVITYPDTVYICRCERGLATEIVDAPVAVNGEVRLPVVLTDTLLTDPSIFTLYMQYDADYLEPIGVDGVDAITQDALLEWQIRNRDTLEVRVDQRFDPAPGNVLFYVRFKVIHGLSATESDIMIPFIRAFSDCCYHQSAPGPNTILIDGLCDKVVSRRADFMLKANTPNPASNTTSFRFTIHENEHFFEAPAVLTLYRSNGTIVDEVYNASVRAGEHIIPYNIASLPAGTYYYTLTINGRTQTRSLVVVK